MLEKIKRKFLLLNNDMPNDGFEIELEVFSDYAICGEIRKYHVFEENEYPGEDDFIARFNVKWDGCTDFRFYGSGYENKDVRTRLVTNKIDGCYHLCGGRGYLDFMRSMAFVSEVALLTIPKIDVDLTEFKDVQSLNLLEGYTIKEVIDENK